MIERHGADRRRVAKNTFLLYFRMLFLMGIGLFTSRVILQTLGVEDFGIYNVVGGFVALFSLVSQSLSSASSRFLTFTMGKGDASKLAKVFSSTLIIHILLAVIIAILAESVGVWFVNNKMLIPLERLTAANWAFHLSVLTFCTTIIIVPYNATIIAHEKMSAFAYISIFEGIAKLLICYLLIISPLDKLVFYALLLFVVHIISKGLYFVYSRRHFDECHVSFVYDKQLLKELFGFAGWNFIGSSSAILRDQGGNVLINLFFGPVVNAARAVANQVLHAVQGFVENFMTALKPQIIKAYASDERDYMMSLIFYGSRLSFYMLLLLSLPILINTDYLLHLWLGTAPDHSTLFVQLILIFTMMESVSHALITAQQATGNIRNYQLVVGGLQLMNLPVSYLVLKLGGVPETIMYVAIFFSVCCLCARLFMLSRNEIQLNVWKFVKNVILNVLVVSVVSSIIPSVTKYFMNETFFSFVLISLICLVCTALTILFIGFNRQERQSVLLKVKQAKSKLFK